MTSLMKGFRSGMFANSVSASGVTLMKRKRVRDAESRAITLPSSLPAATIRTFSGNFCPPIVRSVLSESAAEVISLLARLISSRKIILSLFGFSIA